MAERGQVEAEEKARSSAKEGLAKKVKDAEARAEGLADAVEQLQAGLERQRAAADLRCECFGCMHGGAL